MQRFTLLCCAVVVMGCSKSEPAADTAAAGGAMVAAKMSAADVQGRWTMRNTLEGSDSTVVTYQLDATGDPSGWTITLPNRQPMPVVVSFDADSVMMDAGPFESVLRPGVQVTTRTVSRMQDGRLVGRTTARYPSAGADSVAHLRLEGTRAN